VRLRKFDGVIIHIADTDVEWSALVLAKNDGYCVLCNQKATPAHIFSRRYIKTRLIVENGVPLCVPHHNWYDSLPIKKQEAAAVIFIGRTMYDLLFELHNEKKEVKIWK